MLANADIQSRIGHLKAQRSERLRIDAEWVLSRLVEEADADLADLYDESGHLLPVNEWPKIWRQGLILGVDVEELFDGRGAERQNIGQVKKLRLSDRMKRLEMIGKHVAVNAFSETINTNSLDGL